MAREPDPIKKVRFSHQTNKLTTARISNALGDLYRVRIHSHLTSVQTRTVENAITALEHEYRSLLTLPIINSYSMTTGELLGAKPDLKRIVEERRIFANQFVSQSKLLGSIRNILKLLR
jgi:hypothetical protein